LYMRNEIEFGQVAQAQVGFNFVLDAFSLIVKEFQRITTFAAVVERLGAFYEATENMPASAKPALEIVEEDDRVAFEGLTLTTPDNDRLLIEDFNLQVPEGRR